MTTARDVCTRALKKAGIVGIGNTISGDMINDALDDLNSMIGQWNRNRWLIYRLQDVYVNCDGSQTYLIGPTGGSEISQTKRPDRIETAYLRQIVPSSDTLVDWPVRIIESREDYSRITLKTMTTIAWYVFYDPTYPDGTIYPWPLPNNQYQLHLVIKAILNQFDNLSDEVILPDEYDEALVYNLGRRLRLHYQLEANSELNSFAMSTLATIRGANVALARLRMPRGVINRSNRFNIYSGQGY